VRDLAGKDVLDPDRPLGKLAESTLESVGGELFMDRPLLPWHENSLEGAQALRERINRTEELEHNHEGRGRHTDCAKLVQCLCQLRTRSWRIVDDQDEPSRAGDAREHV